MQYDLPINILSNTDLVVYVCGTERCESLHDFGPAIRDHYIIHYILNGKGIFQANNQTYKLEKNMGFLICPNELTYYQADKDEPWEYSWVGFKGLKADSYLTQAGLSKDAPVFIYNLDDFIENTFKDMISCQKFHDSREIKLVGYLNIFLGHLIEYNTQKKYSSVGIQRREEYLVKALQYIQLNYYLNVTIASLSKYLGLDRSYLYMIFMEFLNISPKEYLTKIRIEKAEEYLKSTSLLIGEVARSVGYEDQLLFSKVFKKYKGESPQIYKKDYLRMLKNNF